MPDRPPSTVHRPTAPRHAQPQSPARDHVWLRRRAGLRYQGDPRLDPAGPCRHWQSTEGIIRESTLYKDPERNNATHFRIIYEFVAAGPLTGNTPRLSGNWFFNLKQQQRFVERFKAGEVVTVYYDAANPAQNCLDRDDRSGVIVYSIMSAGALLLATALVLLIR